jgi:predicted hotdog family 3-hydroxylacyl-ACP dehydratase
MVATKQRDKVAWFARPASQHMAKAAIVVAGNAVGAHHCAAETMQALTEAGFSIPAGGVNLWGKAMGSEYEEAFGRSCVPGLDKKQATACDSSIASVFRLRRPMSGSSSGNVTTSAVFLSGPRSTECHSTDMSRAQSLVHALQRSLGGALRYRCLWNGAQTT